MFCLLVWTSISPFSFYWSARDLATDMFSTGSRPKQTKPDNYSRQDKRVVNILFDNKHRKNCETALIQGIPSIPSISGLLEIDIFGWNCEIWLKLWSLAEIVKFGWNFEIWLKLWILVKIVKFGWYCDIWLMLWYLAEIVKFGWNC